MLQSVAAAECIRIDAATTQPYMVNPASLFSALLDQALQQIGPERLIVRRSRRRRSRHQPRLSDPYSFTVFALYRLLEPGHAHERICRSLDKYFRARDMDGDPNVFAVHERERPISVVGLKISLILIIRFKRPHVRQDRSD
ncbi:hypothetical protein AYJ54_17830 [Bradyrhizobium centrolobii]|uniref:Uncharacterized protein n=2 Tax=Bradyrhizobium TaxID=374 RepID=A0A176ZF65_9BRAD|nr:hypothetical protein AYJ54_17830 [Bradyrhizobium centrolobii]OAF19208.1 hypothetical protein AXW67_37755 [Bradyrhizobium neotropicale]